MNNIYTPEQLTVFNRYKNDYHPIDISKGLDVSIQKDETRNKEEDLEYMGIDPNSLVICIQPTDAPGYDQSVDDIIQAFFPNEKRLSEFAECGYEFKGTEKDCMDWINSNPILKFVGYL